ncbi:LuxR family transcriptional regulator [Streptomyces sulphureus]|uniref:LuxR C-terminal-related transcriptional regulator n=1 Tax=Streptomyces sulphureus TaxID=47758 RepID=UPI0003A5E3BA|nr:LuxR family transcriptional regulator [Streptomyces sulphureus]
MTPSAEQVLPPHVLIPGFESRHDESGILLVRGPKRSGKTTLLHAVNESAAESGARAVSVTGWPSEQQVAFGVLRQLLGQLDEPPGAAVDRGEPSAAVPPGLLTDLQERTYHRLVSVAATQPLLVSVDDINFVDRPTQGFLRFLARRLQGTRIRLVLSERTGQASGHCADFRTDLLRLPHTRLVRLSLLTRETLADWIAERVAHLREPAVRRAAQRIATEVHDVSGGNIPLSGLLVGKYLASAERGGSALTVDADFYDTVRLMIDGSDTPGFGRGARAVAVLGPLCTTQRLSRLLDGDTGLADRVLRTLGELGMTHGTRMRQHIARALLDDPDFTDAADVQLAAARVLFDDGAPVCHVARKLEAAGKIGPPWDLPLVMEVVGRALEEGRAEVAGALLRLVQASAVTTEERAAAEMLLLRSEWLTNPVLVSSLLPSLSGAARQGVLRPADVALLVRAMLLHGYPDRAWELLSALREEPQDPEDEVEVTLAEVLHGVWHGVPPRTPRAEQHGPGAPVSANRCLVIGNHSWLPTVLHKVPDLLDQGDRAGVVFAAEQLLEGIRVRTSEVEPFLFACWVLDAVNSLPLARKWCASLSAALDDFPSPLWRSLLAVVQARIALALGDLTGARRHLQEALAYKPWQEWGSGVGSLAAVLVEALTESGRYEEAAEVLDRPVPPAVFRGVGGLLYVRARGRHHLAVGRLHAAVADFENCRDMSAYLASDLPTVVPWRCDMAEAYLQVGDVKSARGLLQEQLGLLPEEETSVQGMTLRLLAKADAADRRVSLLKASADQLERCGSRLQHAYTLVELAAAYRESACLGPARATIRRAQRMAQQCDAGRLQRLIAAGTAAGAARDDVPPAYGGELGKLSSAERRVAVLAIRGHTNREISTRLFITPSTVEQHLTRIYRKLRVRHRQDLEDRFSSVFEVLGAHA